MHFSVYITLFIIFSFIGFITDSVYCSIEAKKFIKSGYVPYLPLCPVYGFGGIVLFLLQKNMGELPWYFVYPLALVLVLAVEYLGGVYCMKVVKERLWDYTKLPYNLSGHISLFHGAYWLFIIALFLKYLYPYFYSLEQKLLSIYRLNLFQEYAVLAFALFLFFIISSFEFRRRQAKKKTEL